MKTYRDIFKWGDKREEILETAMKKLLVEIFGFEENDFTIDKYNGKQPVLIKNTCQISSELINEIEKICRKENVSKIDDERAIHANGKYYGELLKMRLGIIENPPDLVVFPRNSEEISQIIEICNKKNIPVIPFGGGSSVTGALQAPKGGICIDLSKNMNKILEINVINHSVRLQAGILGPDLEKQLNNFETGYTCGHFPQSFEFSTPGGWIAARGAGTFSTGYGKIEDMVLSLKVVCPSGIIETIDYPADAEGIDLKRIFMGSEGIFGIITEATLKIRKYQPQNTKYASFIFKSFGEAVEAMRQSMQEGYGKPHLYRISDPMETEIAFKLKNFENSFADKILKFLGYKPKERVLMFAAIEGDGKYPGFIKKCLKKTAQKNGAFYLGSKPTKKWLQQKYSSAYARDPLMDIGLITDTIETSVRWQNLVPLYKSITDYLNSRKKTLCMVHISHVYENGANLYITYVSPVEKGNEIADFTQLHDGLVETIVSNKGSLSHHHGIGRVLSPWMKKKLKPNELTIISAIKRELDPNNIMNPGCILHID
jgi:alkyldihydroxyacetonephosphate synthase